MMNYRQALHHRSMYGALNARGLSEGKETRPGTSAQRSARNQSVSSVVLFSAQSVSAGSEARVAWQCIDATSHHSPTETKKPVAEEETDLVHSSNPPNL